MLCIWMETHKNEEVSGEFSQSASCLTVLEINREEAFRISVEQRLVELIKFDYSYKFKI